MTWEFAKGPFEQLGWKTQIDDLRAIQLGKGEDIGCYVEAYFEKAIDHAAPAMEPETKEALKKAAGALADTIEGQCPAAVIPLSPLSKAFFATAYGPDLPPGLILFCAATSEESVLSCAIAVDDMPGDDWPVIVEAQKFAHQNLPAQLWDALFELIEQGDDENKFEAMVNAMCLRTALSGPGALGLLKQSCQAIVKHGYVPLVGAACHRKGERGVAAVTMTLILPPSIGFQIAMAEIGGGGHAN